MAKRRLTAGELDRVREWALARERHEHPSASIEITVKDETNENGEPLYSAVIRRERVVPHHVAL